MSIFYLFIISKIMRFHLYPASNMMKHFNLFIVFKIVFIVAPKYMKIYLFSASLTVLLQFL